MLAASLALAAAPLVHPTPAGTAAAAVLAGPNLAAGKAASASSVTQTYVASNVTDGNQGTYWESANNAFPQWVQVDLGSSVATNQVVLKLPTATGVPATRPSRSRAAPTGRTSPTSSASASRAFNPPSNTVTIDYGTATARYVRIRITANTGWPAGQLSELEVYGPATGDTQAPTAPGNLAFTEPGTGQIRLTWTASTDNVGVTGYDVYANGALRTSVAGTVLTYTDNQPDSATSRTTCARRTPPATSRRTATRSPAPARSGPGTNLALGKPITASGVHVHLRPGQRQRRQRQHLLGGRRQPGHADRRSSAPTRTSARSWSSSTRTRPGDRVPQTIEILGREQSASGVHHLVVPSAAYTFNPATGNSVTIPVSARVADVRLNFTTNTGAPAGQVAEFQVIGVPAPNPDLTITSMSWTPTAPVETDAITLSARRSRTSARRPPAATNVNFYLGTTKVGTAAVGALAAGASTTVTANIGARDAGTYAADREGRRGEHGHRAERDQQHAQPRPTLVVDPGASSDLVAAAVTGRRATRRPATPSRSRSP